MKKLYLMMFALLFVSVSLLNSCKPKDPDDGDNDSSGELEEYMVFNNLESSNWNYLIISNQHNYSLINDKNGDFVSLYGIFSNDTVYIISDLDEGVLSIDFNNNIIQFVFDGDSVTLYLNEECIMYPLNNENREALSGVSNGDVLNFMFGNVLNEFLTTIPQLNAVMSSIQAMKLLYETDDMNHHEKFNYILDGGYKLIPPDLFDWADKKNNDFKSNPLYFIGIKTGNVEVDGITAKCYVDGYLRADGNGVSYDFDYGICFSSNSSVPTIDDQLQYKREAPFYPGNPMSITLTLPISFICSNLEPKTKYYYRAFFKDNITGMVDYAEEIKSFNTEQGTCDPDGEIAGHGYVDLGLPSGKKWATCNVGATSAEDYGDYFAWGEISPKAEYNYYNSITYGEQMSDISGNAQYDAATANWGGSWRMPTKKEYQELVDHCEWEWTQVNGVNGSKVTGPNGSCIFLPAAGYRIGSSLINDGNDGYYWSSTPYDYYYDYDAYYLFFNYGYEHVYWDYYRSDGLTVRPITE